MLIGPVVLQRRLEVQTKLNRVLEESLGARQKEALYLAMIVTSPEAQGQGYGTKLAKIVTRIVSS